MDFNILVRILTDIANRAQILVRIIPDYVVPFVTQGLITVRALPDIVVLPLMGAMGATFLGLFFWMDDLLRKKYD